MTRVCVCMCVHVQVWYKQMMELVEKAQEEYQLKVAMLMVGQDLKATSLQSPPGQTHEETHAIQQDHSSESDGDSGASSHNEEGNEHEERDKAEPRSLLETPWKIFFDQGAVAKGSGDGGAVAKGGGRGGRPHHLTSGDVGGAVGGVGHALNVGAVEFVPMLTFKFNINASAFVPGALDSGGSLNS